MHPLKKDSSASANAKMRRMTAHYGDADPNMKKLAPVDSLKANGPEDAPGFGSDSSASTARGDRPARRSKAANPVSTYAKGGKVPGRAHGGRMKGKGTHVNVIVAPQGAGAGAGALPPPVVPLGGNPAIPPPAAPPKPLMAPPMAPPMGGGMPMAGGPPMMPPPGMMPPRKRGGRVGHADEAEDRAMIKGMVKPSALKRAKGGKVHMTAGAESGPGRLEKTAARARNAKYEHAQKV